MLDRILMLKEVHQYDYLATSNRELQRIYTRINTNLKEIRNYYNLLKMQPYLESVDESISIIKDLGSDDKYILGYNSFDDFEERDFVELNRLLKKLENKS